MKSFNFVSRRASAFASAATVHTGGREESERWLAAAETPTRSRVRPERDAGGVAVRMLCSMAVLVGRRTASRPTQGPIFLKASQVF